MITAEQQRSIALNRLERQINNNHRGYTVNRRHITRSEWLKSLVTEGFNKLEVEPHKSGIGKVYTLLNSNNELYEFRKNVEGEYLQAIIEESNNNG